MHPVSCILCIMHPPPCTLHHANYTLGILNLRAKTFLFGIQFIKPALIIVKPADSAP